MYRSMLVNPVANFNSNVIDFMWARASELPEYLPANYAGQLSRLTME
jgi:hypothetical protein